MLEGFEDLDQKQLEAIGTRQGVDVARLKAALASGAAQRHVDQDRDQAEAMGINGTPTLFLNGRRIVGDEPIEFWRKEVEAELARQAPAPAATIASPEQSALQGQPPGPPPGSRRRSR